jgi:hypothetical protein
MRHLQQELKDPLRDRYIRKNTPRSDLSETAVAMQQAGAPEGFSMEWIFDRFERQSHLTGGQV